jgi:hypothetical protein
VDTHSDNHDNEILDSDSDVPTTSSCKQKQSCAIVFTSDIETSTEEEESSDLESSDDKTSDVWCKTDKKLIVESFFGTTGLNEVIGNYESVVEVVSSIIGDSLVQLLTEQSNLYHSNNAEKWKVLLNNITTKETGKFLGLTILMEQVRKEFPCPFFLTP